MNTFIRSARFSSTISENPPHYHDCHQIIYITRGTIEININETSYVANSNTLILISRLETHSIKILSPEYERYVLRISPSTANVDKDESILHSALVNRPEGFCHVNTVDPAIFLPIIKKITDETKRPSDFSEQLLNAYFKELLIALYRKLPNLFSFDTQHSVLVSQIQKMLEANIDKQHSLSSLANEYHLSTYYLSHMFKSTTGYSVMNYLLSLRINAAKHLLVKSSLSIGEIIEQCGFNDANNFGRTFKKITGQTPSEFRKAQRNDSSTP